MYSFLNTARNVKLLAFRIREITNLQSRIITCIIIPAGQRFRVIVHHQRREHDWPGKWTKLPQAQEYKFLFQTVVSFDCFKQLPERFRTLGLKEVCLLSFAYPALMRVNSSKPWVCRYGDTALESLLSRPSLLRAAHSALHLRDGYSLFTLLAPSVDLSRIYRFIISVNKCCFNYWYP